MPLRSAALAIISCCEYCADRKCRSTSYFISRRGDIERNNNVANVTIAKSGKQRRVPLDAEMITKLSEYVSTVDIPDAQPIFHQARAVRNPSHSCKRGVAEPWVRVCSRVRSGVWAVTRASAVHLRGYRFDVESATLLEWKLIRKTHFAVYRSSHGNAVFSLRCEQ
jgi:hypothetical protein